MCDNKINIYVDMDGVIAEYGFGDSVEEMAAPGYFAGRPVCANAVEAVRMLDRDPRFNVFILSAVFADDHSIEEKSGWLRENGLGSVVSCFVPYGEKKGDYVEKSGINILVDDFSKNLFDWESMGPDFYGIKFTNAGNGCKGSWMERGGFTVSHRMTAEYIYLVISGIAEGLRTASAGSAA